MDMRPASPEGGHREIPKGRAGRSSGWGNYLLGIGLLALVVLAVLAYANIIVSTSLFSAVAVIFVVAALALAFFQWSRVRSAALFTAIAIVLVAGVFYLGHPTVKTGQYQAVFLTNGQVYFGHLRNPESQTPVLTKVYYLQSNQQNVQSTTTNSSTQLSLVKLGNELHGPEDMMALNHSQILFWENLKDSGKVVQAIKQNQKK
jgi:hypothetical protein